MTIDLEAIARRERCELSPLRVALPLLEQGYEPPFLTRYRRDEIGPVAERALWEVVSALRDHSLLEQRRAELKQKFSEAQLDDAALLASIDDAQTPRQLDRIARRIRSESGQSHPSSRLAVRLLNPQPNDPANLDQLAELVVGSEQAKVAVEGLHSVLGQFLAADSRIVQAATAWMDKQVQLHVIDVHDPHEGAAEAPGDSDDHDGAGANTAPTSVKHNAGPKTEFAAGITGNEAQPAASTTTEESAGNTTEPIAADTAKETTEEITEDVAAADADATAAQNADDVDVIDSSDVDAEADHSDLDSEAEAEDQAATDEPASESGESPKNAAKGTAAKSAKESQRKKISPRQRRRKWLVSVLLPLKGKSLPKAKLTAFQVVMLGRALRSQVVQCAFKYNAGELINLLAKTASQLNAQASNELSKIVIDNEAAIREALEAAWWDDLIDRAARRLIKVAANSLRRQMHREPLDADNILVLDAVGPRTAALAIVGPAGEVKHTEDVPCQLTKNFRQQLVARLGELVHQHHVDLIVLSNGPARRACMVALSELLAQSEGSPLRWTLAERGGAEIYAGGPEGNRELRSVPRRFRAAVWLSQLVRSPARALAKVDVARLRLGSYQRELADQQLADALKDVVTSGVCQIGIDANSADRGWLSRLPGVSDAVAEAIDGKRRSALLQNRNELISLEVWPDLVAQRQALGFLRVFAGDQPLDATAIHPDDYPLAEKLMGRLEIPAPPTAPAGYQAPDYSVEAASPAPTVEQPVGPTFTEVKITTVAPDQPFGPSDDEATTASADSEQPQVETEATSEATTAEASPEATAVEDSASEANATAGEASSTETSTTEATSVETADAENAASGTDVAPSDESDSTPASVAAETASVALYKHPLPDFAEVSRLVKEWQVGEHRVRQIVRWLCEPFSDIGMEDLLPTATMPKVPKLNELKPGDLVSGVVVGVAGFGVFVELGPDCSGLIHISRLSEDFVEDLNEFVQIGDIVTAWVVEIDNKRRRVSLSGLSPQRQEELKQQRHERPERHERGSSDTPRGRRGGRSTAPAGAATANAAGSTERKPNQERASQGDREQRGSGRPDRNQGGRSGAATGGGRSQSGGRPQGGGGRGRQGNRRDSGSRGPTSYTTVSRSDAPVTPINEAKRAGEEPLRSFGELMQFFKGARQEPEAAADATSTKKVKEQAPPTSMGDTKESTSSATDQPTPSPAAPVSQPAPEQSSPPQPEGNDQQSQATSGTDHNS